jgi:hypothetical protein
MSLISEIQSIWFLRNKNKRYHEYYKLIYGIIPKNKAANEIFYDVELFAVGGNLEKLDLDGETELKEFEFMLERNIIKKRIKEQRKDSINELLK